jgi:2-hydroxychromene-2-carboxylate isomerase
VSAVFYYDFNSPYVYLVVERIDDLIPDAEWKPIAYPYLAGELGKLESVLGRDFEAVRVDVSERIAERGLPRFNPPDGWPLETWSLAPLRAAVHARERGLVREFTRAAYRKVFVDGRPLTEPATLGDAARVAGLDADEAAEAIQRDEVKDRLKQNTMEALAAGVTGEPTVAVGDQLFWGDDRLDEAASAARA